MIETRPPGNPRILFVEDDVGKRYVIARQLRQHGFDVDEAQTGEQGLAMVSAHHDVAILDIKLPDMAGWDVCKRIKGNPETAAVKVLELSATLASAEDRARGLELGADCYLVHPVELVELVAALRALIRLRRAERERVRAQELFLATLGHDLRNPLNLMSTGLSALADSPTLSVEDKATLQRLERTTDRMTRMVDQLMVFTQAMGDEVVPVTKARIDVGAIVSQVVRDAKHQTARELVLGIDFHEPVHGDADRLTRLVDNLIGNALRHGDGAVTVRLVREGNAAVLTVHNHGTPIAPELLSTLFDPFTRAGGRKGGFGLGLYIVDQVTRAHGGTITVTSTEAEGTTFAVRLPIT